MRTHELERTEDARVGTIGFPDRLRQQGQCLRHPLNRQPGLAVLLIGLTAAELVQGFLQGGGDRKAMDAGRRTIR